MKISFSSLACPEWTLPEILARGEEYGYDGIELRGIGPDLDVTKSPHFSTPRACRESLELAQEHGLTYCAIDTSTQLTKKDSVERRDHLDMARSAIDLAAQIGAGWVRVFGGEPARDITKPEAIDLCAQGLFELGEYASKQGDITVVLETHDYFSLGEDVADALLRAAHPNAGALWDLHHPYRHGEAAQRTYNFLKPFLSFTHIKDSKEGGTYCLLGEGDVPLREMVGLIIDGGYHGWLSLEWEKRWIPALPDPEIALPQYASKLREYLAV